MSSLDQFIGEVRSKGLARQNRFTLDITLPSGMSNTYHELQLVHLFCEQAVLPGIALSTQPIRTFGENREVVYDRNFENITLTFLVDTNMLVKKLFDDWMNAIIDPVTRLNRYYETYATQMNIIVQNIANNDMYECVLFEAYPKSIQAITLDNNSKDVMKLNVTFAYKNHITKNWGATDANVKTFNNTLIPNNSETMSLQQYSRNAMTIDSNTNELYYSNFTEYQQKLADATSLRSAVSKLERQGFETNLGGVFL